MKRKLIISSILLSLSTASFAQIVPRYYDWMSSEVKYSGWDKGYTGQDTQIVIFDFFTTTDPFAANLDGTMRTARHGSHVGKAARLLSPNATVKYADYDSTTMKALPVDSSKSLNIVNASLALFTTEDSVQTGQLFGNSLTKSLITHAKNGTALVVKSAGNDAVNMGEILPSGTNKDKEDGLNTALLSSNSVIYVGALSNFGTVANKATMASYSNKAGSDIEYQKRFLVAGVRGNKIGVGGTSFASPIVSSYAAIVGSKFKTATPTKVANQLLNTARTDTVLDYSAAVHGRGEVSLTRALAPVTLR